MDAIINSENKHVTRLGRTTVLLSLLTLLSAILTIIFDLNGSQTSLYIFKPLSTILIHLRPHLAC